MKNFIINNQKDIALMFEDYGINAPVTRENILAAIEQEGEPFVLDFALLAEQKIANYDGKGKKMSSEQIAGMISGILGAGSAVAGAFGPQVTAAPVAVENNTKDKEKEADNKQMYMIAAAVGVIILLVIVALFASKK